MTSPEMKDPITLPREDVDALANEIRRVDGDNSLGAGALAEALMPFIAARQSLASAPQVGGDAEGPHLEVKMIRAAIARLAWPSVDTDGAKEILEIVAARLAALSQEAEAVAWRWRFDADGQWHYGAEKPVRFRFGDPDEIQRLIVHPSDRGGEVKG